MIETLMTWSQWWWSALLVHLTQSSVLFALVLLVAGLLRNATPDLRYRLWLVSSLKFALPASLVGLALAWTGVVLPDLTAPVRESWAVTLGNVAIDPAGRSVGGQLPSVAETASEWRLLGLGLSVVWALVSAGLLFGWSKASIALRKTMRAGVEVRSGRELIVLGRARGRLGLSRDVRMLRTRHLQAPLVAGIWRPTVLLPKGAADCLNDAELEAVLMHELAHVRRSDNLISFLHKIVCCLFWFWPLVWVVDRRLTSERELACDRQVVDLRGDSSAYIAGILKVCRLTLISGATSASFASGSDLQRRMRALMDRTKTPRVGLKYHLVFSTFLALAGILTLATAPRAATDAIAEAGPVVAQADQGRPAGARTELRDASTSQSPMSVLASVKNGKPVSFKVTNRSPRDVSRFWVAIEPEDRGTVLLVQFKQPVGQNATVDLSPETQGTRLIIRGANKTTVRGGEVSEEWRRRLSEHPEEFRVKVVGAIFKDGEEWFEEGYVPPPPPPPPPPPAPPEPPEPPEPPVPPVPDEE